MYRVRHDDFHKTFVLERNMEHYSFFFLKVPSFSVIITQTLLPMYLLGMSAFPDIPIGECYKRLTYILR